MSQPLVVYSAQLKFLDPKDETVDVDRNDPPRNISCVATNGKDTDNCGVSILWTKNRGVVSGKSGFKKP
jgi:hypothetical protein